MRCLVLSAVVAVLAVMAGARVAADERSAAQSAAAQQFSFEGIGLATSLTAFLEKYPDAELLTAESSMSAGVITHRVKTLQSADAADYAFLNGVLYSVTVFYTPDRLEKMGGETIPFKKLVQKLGPQDKDSPGISRKDGEQSFRANWDFGSQQRRINFVATAKMSYISFVDTTKAAQADKKITEKANLGF